ncbi:hypothetical protein AB0B50_44140 [Streptomyces sp. NPDC041068]|uniref:hypothetical protein n=1 Tax=Streptomyces sp. NPDC041068 TaxID=3155130 RepID=UPI0033E9BE96
MRRWIKVSVAAVAVLGVGGYIAEPHVQDWTLAGSACDGALPRAAVDALAPKDSHLDEEKSRQVDGLGYYSCSLTAEGDDVRDERLVEMEAFTRRDDQDREFMAVFADGGFAPQGRLPDGLPGFVDEFGSVQLLLPCPDLGKDAEGRQRKLLVRTTLGSQTHVGVPGAAYRTAVALANKASGKLGCGAERISVPERDVPLAMPGEDDPKPVPLSRAKGTPCAWATRADLPKDLDWRMEVNANDAGPTGRCDLYTTPDDTHSRLSLAAWYGDWGNRLLGDGIIGKPPFATATARCHGEAANYALSASDDTPGVSKAAKRRMLKEFAEDQTARRGCSTPRYSF